MINHGEIAPTSENILTHPSRFNWRCRSNHPEFSFNDWFLEICSALSFHSYQAAENASLTLLKLAELGLEAGIPEGVFNVITGEGEITGKAPVMHMDVDVIAFTGSGEVGRKILEYSSLSNLKRVYLELGGNLKYCLC